MALVVTAILSIYVFILVEEKHIHDGGKYHFVNKYLFPVPITSITWNQYKKEVGFDAFA